MVVNTVPKSGTNMLWPAVGAAVAPGAQWIQLFQGLPDELAEHRAAITAAKRPALVRGHIYHSPAWAALRRELGLKMVFLYRDPRDVVVSYVHWLEGPDRNVGAIQTYIRDELHDHGERLRAMITGFKYGAYRHPDIGAFMNLFIGWRSEPEVECVRFEDLVGDGRRACLARIVRYLYASPPSSEEAEILERMVQAMDPASSTTYRQGIVGTWRDEFDNSTLQLFNGFAGDIVTTLGYDIGANV